MLRDRVELDRLYLIWPTVPQFHDDDAALLLLGDILARGRSSRLYRKLVIERADRAGRHRLPIGPRAGWDRSGSSSRSGRRGRSARHAAWSKPSSPPIAAEGVTRRRAASGSRTCGSPSFFFALEHIGGFGGVADRLNAYNVFRGDPALITADVDRFQRVTARRA